MAKHAKLPASASSRWMKCPGSVAASAGHETPSGFFAQQGTAAHKLVEHMLTERETDAREYLGFFISVHEEEDSVLSDAEPAEEPGWDVFKVDDDMADAVQVMIDTVEDIRAKASTHAEEYIERYLDLSQLHPALGGTADYLLVEPFNWATLVDYKHGSGVVVEVLDNSQLKTYALGAFRENRDLDGVRMYIVQPRAPHEDGRVRMVEYTALELLEFEREVLSAALATEEDDAPRVPGDHCRFCDAKPFCRELHLEVQKQAGLDFDDEPEALPAPTHGHRLARILQWAPMIDSLLRDAEGAVQRELEAGRPVPGYKLVRKKSNRQWALSEDDVVERVLLAQMVDRKDDIAAAACYDEPKLKSPAKMEKMGKAVKEVVNGKRAKDGSWEIEPIAMKPEGGLTVAAEDDPRPAVDTTMLAAQDFAEDVE